MQIRWSGFEAGGNDSHDGLFRIIKEVDGYELYRWQSVSKNRYGWVQIGFFGKIAKAKEIAQAIKDGLPLREQGGLKGRYAPEVLTQGWTGA